MSNSTCAPDRCANPGPRGGLCRDCQNARALAKYYANLEERRAANKRWRESNPERQRERVAQWLADNAERRAAYREANRERDNEQSRARRAANPGAGTVYSRDWRKANPERWALRNRANQHRRRTGERVDFSRVLVRDGMVCHICGEAIASLADLHFDHVVPLAKGGAHHEANIKPAHALCNLRKSDHLI